MALSLIRQQPQFGLLWAAQLISFIGDGVFQLAMVWWLVQKTGSGTLVGLILSVSFLPVVFLGPLAGTLADRLYPKILLIGADLVRAILIAFFAYIAYTDNLVVGHLFLLCGLLAAAGVFHSPTTLTVIPRVVPEDKIEEAMALHSIVRDLAKLVGPALGGFIMAWFSAAQAFLIDSIALVFSAILICFIKLEKPPSADSKEGIFSQLWIGLKYVKSQTILFEMLFGFGLLNLFVVPIIVLLPMTVNKVMMLGSVHLGFCEGSLALGSVITGIYFTWLFGKIKLSKLLISALGFSGLLFLLFSVNTAFAVFLCGLFLLGGCFTSVNVAVLTLYQKMVDPEMKGRFFALVETLSSALFPLSMAAAGFLTDRIGVRATYLICSFGILILSLRFSRIPKLSSIDSTP